LESFRHERIDPEKRFDAFQKRYDTRWRTRSKEEWALMLILWHDAHGNRSLHDDVDPDASLPEQMKDFLRIELRGEKIGAQLSNNLASWLRSPLSSWQPYHDHPWFAKLIGGRVITRLDPQWVATMVYENTVKLETLNAAVEIGGPSLARMALVVLSLTPGGRIAGFAFQSIVGLLDFLFTIWETEQDDIITEEEVKDVEWAGLGIVGFDPLQLSIMTVRIGMAIGELLNSLAMGAKQLVEELPSRVAAAQAGYDEFVSTVFTDPEAADNVFVLLDD
jgi:hypothetical protein